MPYNTPVTLFDPETRGQMNSVPAEVAEAASLDAYKNRIDLFMCDNMYNL